MRCAVVLCSLLLGILITPAVAETPDFFAPRTGLDADTVLYLNAWSGSTEAIERLRARLEQMPPPADAYSDWSFLCAFDLHLAQYAKAVPACEKAVALNPKGDDANTLAIARLLVGQPAPRAHGSARLPVTPGVHVPVKAGGFNGMAIADTGAEISVMMQSVAKTAHVKMLGASRNVGSTTGDVSGHIGLIPAVKLGDAEVTNLPVLVLPDAQLTVSDGKKTMSLPFILSLYALADFGRIAWLDHGKWLALGSAAPPSLPGAVPMIWHPMGIAVPLQGPGGARAAQFDTGADFSYLFDSGVSLLSDADRAAIVSATRKIGGVGGIVEEKVRRVPQAHLMLAGQPLLLTNIDVAKQPETGEAARLGEDVLQTYSEVVFDFGAMTFSVVP
jgi:hypothetical protein